MKTTFKENKQIWKNGVRVLLEQNWSARVAIRTFKDVHPYLFISIAELQNIEDSFKN